MSNKEPGSGHRQTEQTEQTAPPATPGPGSSETRPDQPFPRMWLTSLFFERFPDAAIAFDDNGTLIGWNRAAEHLFGSAHKDAIGLSVWPLIDKGSVDRFHRAVSLVREGGSWRGPLSIIIRNTPTRVELRLALVGEDDAPGRVVVAIVCTVPDRSANRRAAREAARWAGTRSLLLAMLEEDDGSPRTPVAEWIRFFTQVRWSEATRLERGCEDSVLVVGFAPIAREVLAAFLGRNGYPSLTESDLSAVLDTASVNRERLQLALLGPELSGAVGHNLIQELRRTIPFLPVVTCGWSATSSAEFPQVAFPISPIELLRTLAVQIGQNQIEERHPPGE